MIKTKQGDRSEMVIGTGRMGLFCKSSTGFHPILQKPSVGNNSDDEECVAHRDYAFSLSPGMRTAQTDHHPQWTWSTSRK